MSSEQKRAAVGPAVLFASLHRVWRCYLDYSGSFSTNTGVYRGLRRLHPFCRAHPRQRRRPRSRRRRPVSLRACHRAGRLRLPGAPRVHRVDAPSNPLSGFRLGLCRVLGRWT